MPHRSDSVKSQLVTRSGKDATIADMEQKVLAGYGYKGSLADMRAAYCKAKGWSLTQYLANVDTIGLLP